MDAYQLATELSNHGQLPSRGFSGYTGDLYLNPYRQIKRGLVCVQFVQGVPVKN
jgi:outer membrane PBP1 activator LpoA protein